MQYCMKGSNFFFLTDPCQVMKLLLEPIDFKTLGLIEIYQSDL